MDVLNVFVNGVKYGEIKIEAKIVRPKLHINCKSYNLKTAQDLIAKHGAVLKQSKVDFDYLNQVSQSVVYLELNTHNAFQKTISKELIIQNIGTSPVDCFFQLMFPNEQKNSETLQINIEQRQIDIGDDCALKIFWLPLQQDVTTAILQVSFQEAKFEPYYIPIICKLTPGKATVPNRTLDFGVVNVSKMLSASFSLQNMSSNQSCFYEIMTDQL